MTFFIYFSIVSCVHWVLKLEVRQRVYPRELYMSHKVRNQTKLKLWHSLRIYSTSCRLPHALHSTDTHFRFHYTSMSCLGYVRYTTCVHPRFLFVFCLFIDWCLFLIVYSISFHFEIFFFFFFFFFFLLLLVVVVAVVVVVIVVVISLDQWCKHPPDAWAVWGRSSQVSHWFYVVL